MATKNSKSVVSQSDPLEQALKQIANCLGYLVVHSDQLKDMSNNDLIPILASLGFDRNAIASILQTTPETVSVRLSQLKARSSNKNISKNKTKIDSENTQNIDDVQPEL